MTEAVTTMLSVRLLSSGGPLFEGDAVSLTARNKLGVFDVLAGHANFFTLLVASDIVLNVGSEKLMFPVNSGMLKVKNNAVVVFANRRIAEVS